MNFHAFEGIILADMRKQEFEETTQKVKRKLEKEVYKQKVFSTEGGLKLVLMISIINATYSFALPLIKLSRMPSKALNSFNNRLCKFSRDSSVFDFEILFARNQYHLQGNVSKIRFQGNQLTNLSNLRC